MHDSPDEPRLRRLVEAVPDVIGELDLATVLERIVHAAVDLVDARWGALGVIGPDGSLAQFVHVGMSASDARAIGHLPEGHGVLGAVIDTGEPIRLEHLADDPRSAGFPAAHPSMDAFLGVPIRIRDRVFGNLYLTGEDGGRAFSEEDQRLVGSLAAVAAIAIENARLYEESVRRERWSTALAEVSAALLSEDTVDILAVLAERVASVIDSELVCVIVADGESDGVPMLRVDTARGVGADALIGRRYPAEGTLSGRAIATGVTVSTDGEIGESVVRDGPSAAIALPVHSGEKVLGALTVYRATDAPRFTDADRAMAAEFALQTGVAIELTRGRADRQRLALVEERARIARDLHDHVIQRLFGTGLALQAVAARAPETADAIAAQVDAIDSAIGEIRTAIFALASRPASDDSIRHRLLDVATDAAPGLANPPLVTFSGPVDLLVRGGVADDVLAAVRESLANAARHAAASRVEVAVTADEDQVTVTVDDDGVGLPEGSRRASGTRNLAERAQQRGGSYELTPRPGGGTRVRWSAPIAPPERSTP
ncbi:GAF domain-containing protein [Homoserinibacter sp. GY 40078]|uniref:sensor histidine kinase n=1 Tax=Homoserinibacter sp. GY 40078 TaxID=2603275 RepID=UPI0011C96D48|nr:GAF domain-containing protein [Homoserinibacter sp. GY 40078]TXK19671.1 GAF domain-containing protein [Homoserinibacter sp. GY 40078]